MRLFEVDVLRRPDISPEALELAEALHHEARLERIHTLIELAFRRVYFNGLRDGACKGCCCV